MHVFIGKTWAKCGEEKCCDELNRSPYIGPQSLLPLMFAKTAAAAVLASALLPLVFAKTAAAAVLALPLPPLVFAKTAAAAVLALALPPLVFA